MSEATKAKTKRDTNPKPRPPDPEKASAFYTAANVAWLLNKSYGYILKAAGSPILPKPVRLGRSVQWNRKKFDAWLDAGCPRGAK